MYFDNSKINHKLSWEINKNTNKI